MFSINPDKGLCILRAALLVQLLPLTQLLRGGRPLFFLCA